MPRVLIIGAKGMLGQDLMRAFEGASATGWDREEIDITDSGQVAAKIERLKPGLIINAAAYNAVDEAESPAGSETAFRVNASAVENLAKTAQAIGAVFMHFSTDYVFDGTKKEGYREDDAPNPLSAYGRSKYRGEQLALKYAERCYVIRTSRLFGKPSLSQNAKKSFVDVMRERAATQAEIKVIDDEFSKPTSTADLAAAVRRLIEERYPFGVYHLVNEGACSWYEWAQEIAAIKKLAVTLTPVPSSAFSRPAKRPKHSILLNTKFPLLRNYKEALQEYLKTDSKNF